MSSQKSFSPEVIVETHTDTPMRSITLPGPLEWSIKDRGQIFLQFLGKNRQ